jgi:hypothetical protein
VVFFRDSTCLPSDAVDVYSPGPAPRTMDTHINQVNDASAGRAHARCRHTDMTRAGMRFTHHYDARAHTHRHTRARAHTRTHTHTHTHTHTRTHTHARTHTHTHRARAHTQRQATPRPPTQRRGWHGNARHTPGDAAPPVPPKRSDDPNFTVASLRRTDNTCAAQRATSNAATAAALARVRVCAGTCVCVCVRVCACACVCACEEARCGMREEARCVFEMR